MCKVGKGPKNSRKTEKKKKKMKWRIIIKFLISLNGKLWLNLLFCCIKCIPYGYRWKPNSWISIFHFPRNRNGDNLLKFLFFFYFFIFLLLLHSSVRFWKEDLFMLTLRRICRFDDNVMMVLCWTLDLLRNHIGNTFSTLKKNQVLFSEHVHFPWFSIPSDYIKSN